MHAILIHGMGRTPLSMVLLAIRLRLAGIRPHLFGYSAAFEGWQSCASRLTRFIETHTEHDNYIVVGHSLGTVLTRAVLPRLSRPPKACFLLAPPTIACLAARKFAPLKLYQWLTGEIGQLLAKQEFMAALPQPTAPAKIYAGVGGATGRYSLFGKQPNDGILALHETLLPQISVLIVPSVHTFIMNARAVAQDIIRLASETLETPAQEIQK